MSASEQDTELALFRDSVRRFVKERVAPYYEEWESAGIIPRETWRELGAAGMLGTDIPLEYGGVGADFRFSVVVQQEIARAGFLALACNITVHSDIVAHYVLNAGTEAQKQRYLPKMVSGDCVGAIAMTEPGAGSDLQSHPRQRAARWRRLEDQRRQDLHHQRPARGPGDHRGEDRSLGAGIQGHLAAAGRCRRAGLRARPQPGKARAARARTPRSSSTATCAWDRSALLGGLNRGFAVLMNELPRERLGLVDRRRWRTRAVRWTSRSPTSRSATPSASRSRRSRTRAIAWPRWQAAITVHERFLDSCIASLMRHELDTATASIAKLSCTELEDQVVDGCLQLFGGYGYMREYPISRFYADSRVQRIYGGTSEIMKELISRDVLK